MMEIVTIKDIAKVLNLSASTVSRALRDSYEISEATKKIVTEFAKKHNYSPNPIALSLKENKSKSIGVLVPEIDNPFFSQIINGIESEAYIRGYHVLIFQSYDTLEREKISLKHMISRRVDGILLSTTAESDDVSHLIDIQAKGTPIVLFDRATDKLEAHKVITENFQGAFDATELLIKNGKKRIAYLGSSPNYSITNERLLGYKAALDKYNFIHNPDLIRASTYSAENVENEIKSLLSLKNPPDALVSTSERQAIICMIILKKLGIKIPDDIAFISFSNLRSAPLFSPPLSTITQPAYEMGFKAAQLLLDFIESKPQEKKNIVFQTIRLKTELFIRDSTN